MGSDPLLYSALKNQQPVNGKYGPDKRFSALLRGAIRDGTGLPATGCGNYLCFHATKLQSANNRRVPLRRPASVDPHVRGEAPASRNGIDHSVHSVDNGAVERILPEHILRR